MTGASSAACGLSAPRFDSNYRESIHLADGTIVTFRLVQPADEDLLLRGFERLSFQSRYQRFFGAKPKLSVYDVEYLTHPDGTNHVAIGAVRKLPNGNEEGLGIARFIRLPNQPQAAEAAIAIVDDWHGRGIGRQLLKRLAAAARERRIAFFTAHVQRTNTAMRALLASFPHVTEQAESGTLQIRLELSHPATDEVAGESSPERVGPPGTRDRCRPLSLRVSRRVWRSRQDQAAEATPSSPGA
jgi:GNAT superfamily N-acetyltransferase